MTDTEPEPERSPKRQRLLVYASLAMDIVLMIFSVCAVLTGWTYAAAAGVVLWVVALIVMVPAFSTKIPELKKPSNVSAVLFLVATVAAFIASTGMGF